MQRREDFILLMSSKQKIKLNNDEDKKIILLLLLNTSILCISQTIELKKANFKITNFEKQLYSIIKRNPCYENTGIYLLHFEKRNLKQGVYIHVSEYSKHVNYKVKITNYLTCNNQLFFLTNNTPSEFIEVYNVKKRFHFIEKDKISSPGGSLSLSLKYQNNKITLIGDYCGE